jgi:hypothetical protein
VTGDRVNVALVAHDQEVEELGQRIGLVVHRQPGAAQFPALVSQEPVDVRGLRGPHRAAEVPDELEDRRSILGDRGIARPRTNCCEQVLIDQVLLEILELLRCPGSPRKVDRSDYRQRHAGPHPSPDGRSSHGCRRCFTNPELLSRRRSAPVRRMTPGIGPCRETRWDREPRGVPTTNDAINGEHADDAPADDVAGGEDLAGVA